MSNFLKSTATESNPLLKYVQSLDPETIAQLSKPSSPEVAQLMDRHLVGLLGGLPAEHFNVTITTNREHLGQLMAAAMVNGYFLRAAEQRMQFEQALQATANDSE